MLNGVILLYVFQVMKVILSNVILFKIISMILTFVMLSRVCLSVCCECIGFLWAWLIHSGCDC